MTGLLRRAGASRRAARPVIRRWRMAEFKKDGRWFKASAVFYYQLICDRCGGLSREGLSPEEALEIAEEDGWSLGRKTLCPLCAGEELTEA